MTKWIRLRETLSGGRADGRPWPVAGEVIDVPAWEYDHCIAAGWAEHADPPISTPEKAKDPGPEKAKASEMPPEEISEWGPEHGAVQEKKVPEQEEAVSEPPRPSDPKQDWVDYAADRGLPRDKAEAMSKADLMSRFGGRL
jgi:hypothetical protein